MPIPVVKYVLFRRTLEDGGRILLLADRLHKGFHNCFSGLCSILMCTRKGSGNGPTVILVQPVRAGFIEFYSLPPPLLRAPPALPAESSLFYPSAPEAQRPVHRRLHVCLWTTISRTGAAVALCYGRIRGNGQVGIPPGLSLTGLFGGGF